MQLSHWYNRCMYTWWWTKLRREKDLEEGPPEKETRTLSVGEIIALEVTASLNLPNRLPRKQSKQNRPMSPSTKTVPEEARVSFTLHLRQRLWWLGRSRSLPLERAPLVNFFFSVTTESSSSRRQPDWQFPAAQAMAIADGLGTFRVSWFRSSEACRVLALVLFRTCLESPLP